MLHLVGYILEYTNSARPPERQISINFPLEKFYMEFMFKQNFTKI